MDWLGYQLKAGPAQCKDNASCQTCTKRGTVRPHSSPVIISVPIKFRI